MVRGWVMRAATGRDAKGKGRVRTRDLAARVSACMQRRLLLLLRRRRRLADMRAIMCARGLGGLSAVGGVL